MTPQLQTVGLNASLINSTGFRLKYTKGDGIKRLVAVTEGNINSICQPVNGMTYSGNLNYKKGDKLTSLEDPIMSTSSCVGATYAPLTSTQSTTYVAYNGIDDGTIGLDIINLNAGKEYQIMVYEYTDLCYATASQVLTLFSGFNTNLSRITVTVYNNRTKKIIKNADVIIRDRRNFTASFGKTNDKGMFITQDIEVGRYELNVHTDNYEPKILSGIFIQESETMRDNNYRIFTTTGQTEVGGPVERARLKNKNEYIVYLDPLNTTNHSYTKFNSNDNPSYLTKR